MFSSTLVSELVCLLVGLCKTSQPIFIKFDGKAAHGPWKENRLILVVIHDSHIRLWR